MKYKILYVVLTLLVLIACGSDQGVEAAQVGIALQDVTPMHGHSGTTDGGTLNAPSFFVYSNGQLSATANVWSKINLENIIFTSGTTFDIINYRHVPTVKGKYLYIGNVCGYCATTFSRMQTNLVKNNFNNSITIFSINTAFTPFQLSCVTSHFIMDMNGTTDYVELWGLMNGTGECNFANNNLSGIFISR